jgi:hypothetical protein
MADAMFSAGPIGSSDRYSENVGYLVGAEGCGCFNRERKK